MRVVIKGAAMERPVDFSKRMTLRPGDEAPRRATLGPDNVRGLLSAGFLGAILRETRNEAAAVAAEFSLDPSVGGALEDSRGLARR